MDECEFFAKELEILKQHKEPSTIEEREQRRRLHGNLQQAEKRAYYYAREIVSRRIKYKTTIELDWRVARWFVAYDVERFMTLLRELAQQGSQKYGVEVNLKISPLIEVECGIDRESKTLLLQHMGEDKSALYQLYGDCLCSRIMPYRSIMWHPSDRIFGKPSTKIFEFDDEKAVCQLEGIFNNGKIVTQKLRKIRAEHAQIELNEYQNLVTRARGAIGHTISAETSREDIDDIAVARVLVGERKTALDKREKYLKEVIKANDGS